MSFLDQRELANPAPSEVPHLKVGGVGDDQGARSSASVLPSGQNATGPGPSEASWGPNCFPVATSHRRATLALDNQRVASHDH
jgi:hypothetical protein